MPEGPLPRLPAGLTAAEEKLWVQLYREWDSGLGVAMTSIKTPPLSETAKDAIRKLARAAGMTVDFPLLPDPVDPENRPAVNTVYAIRSRK